MSGMFGIDAAPAWRELRWFVGRWIQPFQGWGVFVGGFPGLPAAGNPGLVDSIPLGLCRGYVVEWRGAKRTP
jgi:hypothetical protein